MLEQSLVSGARRHYEVFYKEWLEVQKQFLRQLQEALKRGATEQELKALVQQAAKHYAYYYRIKNEAAKEDILQFFNPAWKTPLEAAFMWIGGWRPSLVFQLAYAQAGQQIEEELAELMAGMEAPTVASITALQLEKINELHVKTLKLEENYSQQEAVLQQGMADQPFVSLAQSVTPALGEGGSSSDALQETVETLEENIDEKLKELENLLHEADRLRAEALHGVLEIFTTTQAAQFLVAATQLQLAYKAIGNNKRKQEDEQEQEQNRNKGQEQNRNR